MTNALFPSKAPQEPAERMQLTPISTQPSEATAASTSAVTVFSAGSLPFGISQKDSSIYVNTASLQQDTNPELIEWDKKCRNPKLSSSAQGALVQELESSSSAFCKELVLQAKKIKYYDTRKFSNLKRVINRKHVSMMLEKIVVYINNEELKNFTTRPLTPKQGKVIIELMKAAIRTNQYVARCYNRFTSLRQRWELLEAPLKGSTPKRKLFPDHTILSIALVIEDAINRATASLSSSTEFAPYYIFRRTILLNFGTKKAYIISKKMVDWEYKKGGAKVYRTALEVDFTYLTLFRVVGALKSRVAANLSQISREFDLQRQLQKLPYISGVECTWRGISKQQKTDKEFEQLFAIVPPHQTDLFNFINSQSYTDDDQLHIAVDILQALAQLHERKIIHGDVKDGNVFIDRDTNHVCHAYLGDFGLSSQVKATYYTTLYGTPHISDPSLLLSTASVIFQGDYTKLDLFAFGILLYELLYKSSPEWCTEMETICSLHKASPIDQERITALRDTAFTKINTYRSSIQNKLSIAFNEENNRYTIKSNCAKAELLEYITYHLLNPLPEQRLSAFDAMKALASLMNHPIS